jgi:hypothetical protein
MTDAYNTFIEDYKRKHPKRKLIDAVEAARRDPRVTLELRYCPLRQEQEGYDPKIIKSWKDLFLDHMLDHSGWEKDKRKVLDDNKELEAKVKQLEAEVEELKKLKEQTEEQTLAKLFKKMLA